MIDLTDDVLPELRETDGFFYVGSAYSLYPMGHSAANRMACEVTGELLRQGLNVFSPIAHSHAVAMLAGLDNLDWSLWMRANRPLMEAAAGLIVIKSAGWQESRGLAEEIAFFRESCLPIYSATYGG